MLFGILRKYIKPELEFVSFKVKADVMVNPTTAPAATVGAYISNEISEGNMYIKEDALNKAWTSVDGTDWTWVE